MLEARAQSADDTAESRCPGTTRATGSTPAIDGIFCINDYAAFGVIRGLADYGIRVPDDVRVIGFDGATAGSYTTPTLSTVQVDLDQLAQFALDMITRRVEQRDPRATAGPTNPLACRPRAPPLDTHWFRASPLSVRPNR